MSVSDPAIIVRRMQIADQRWQAAVDDSAFAPPDPGFADRVRAIAIAAEGEAVVLHEAARNPRLRWQPAHSNAVGLSYELRPGGNRPGPSRSWTDFDHAVEHVSATQQATDFAEIADAFRQLAITAMRLAGQIDAERQDDTTPQRSIADAG
jgi:hypothetical protein